MADHDTPGAETTAELKFDTDNLYREETFTDRRSGSIRRLVPVDAQGNPDSGREVLYFGEAQAMTPAGALPLSFPLEAENLEQAAAQFPDAARKALEETVEELRRMQHESQNSIMVPGQGGGQGGSGGMGGMGGAGGGKIQF